MEEPGAAEREVLAIFARACMKEDCFAEDEDETNLEGPSYEVCCVVVQTISCTDKNCLFKPVFVISSAIGNIGLFFSHRILSAYNEHTTLFYTTKYSEIDGYICAINL